MPLHILKEATASDVCAFFGSFRNSVLAELSAQVLFTELAFVVERDGYGAYICGTNVSCGGTCTAPTGTYGFITAWEKFSTTGAEWPIELSHQLKKSSNNNLCLIACRQGGKFEVFRKPFGTHSEKCFLIRQRHANSIKRKLVDSAYLTWIHFRCKWTLHFGVQDHLLDLTISSYRTTDSVGFEEQRDATPFSPACEAEETLLQFLGSAVNPFPVARDVLVFLCIRAVRRDATFGNL